MTDSDATARAVVLVVDDEPMLRSATALALESEGFAPVVAGSVAEAIDVLAHTAIDLVLTDVAMPGADGIALARHVRRRRPGVAVVFMSGQLQPDVANELDDIPFVRKPFTAGEIVAAVAAGLARR
jgi:CheY-like chemotaxis protein